MVKDIVEVRANFQSRRIAEFEKLANAKVHSPRAGSGENIAPGDIGVIEGISTNRRRRKRVFVKELIALLNVLRARNQRSETGATKAANRIDEFTGDISWEYGVTSIAEPKWRKPSSALGEHIPGKLEAAERSVSPLRNIGAKFSALTEWEFINTIRNKSMA